MKATAIFLAVVMLCLTSSHPLAGQRRPDRLFKQGQTDLFMQVGVLPTYLMDKARIVLPAHWPPGRTPFWQKLQLGFGDIAFQIPEDRFFYPNRRGAGICKHLLFHWSAECGSLRLRPGGGGDRPLWWLHTWLQPYFH